MIVHSSLFGSRRLAVQMLISSCRSSCGLRESHFYLEGLLGFFCSPCFSACLTCARKDMPFTWKALCCPLMPVLCGLLTHMKVIYGMVSNSVRTGLCFQRALAVSLPNLAYTVSGPDFPLLSPITPVLSFSQHLYFSLQHPKQPAWLSAQRVPYSRSNPTFFSWYVCSNLSLVWGSLTCIELFALLQ